MDVLHQPARVGLILILRVRSHWGEPTAEPLNPCGAGVGPKPSVAAGRLREAQFTAIVAAAIASRLSHSIRFASASADAGYQPFAIE